LGGYRVSGHSLERKFQITNPTWSNIFGLADFAAAGNDIEPISDSFAAGQPRAFHQVRFLR